MGLFRPKLFLLVVGTLASQLFASTPYDLMRYLANPPQMVVDEENTRTVHSGHHLENIDSYIVALPNGRRFDLEIPDRLAAISLLSSVQVLTLLDLPVRPYYPVFVQPGVNGAPTFDVTQRIYPSNRPSHLKKGKWVLGYLAPIAHNYDSGFGQRADSAPSDDHAVALWVEAWVSYALGYHLKTWTTTDNTMISSADNAGMHYWDPKSPNSTQDWEFERWFEKFSRNFRFSRSSTVVRSQDVHFRTKLAMRLFYIAKRMEHLAAGPEGLKRLSSLIYPVLAEKGLMQTSAVLAKIQARMVGAPLQVKNWLNRLSPAYKEITLMDYALTDFTFAAVNLNELRDRVALISSGRKTDISFTPKEALLAYAFADAGQREVLEKRFVAAFPNLQETDLLRSLMNYANDTDNTRMIVHLGGLDRDHKLDSVTNKRTQTYLNTSRPKSLVVVVPNDPEARVIRDATIEMMQLLNKGSDEKILLYTDLVEIKPGIPLDNVTIQNIVEYAKQKGIKELVLCEQTNSVEKFEALLHGTGISLRHLDHHNKSWNKDSTAMQFFDLWGYRPCIYQIAVSTRDSGGASSLYQLGLPKDQVTKFLVDTASVSTNALINELSPLIRDRKPGDRPPIYLIFHDERVAFAAVDHALAILHAKEGAPANFVLLNGATGYVAGTKEFYEMATELLDRNQVIERLLVSRGGDVSRYYGSFTINRGLEKGSLPASLAGQMTHKFPQHCLYTTHLLGSY